MRAMGLLPGRSWRRRGEAGMQPCRRSESSQVAPHPPLCRQGPARRQDRLGELHLHNAADFWELPEGNLRALPVLQRILEQSNLSKYRNSAAIKGAVEWTNANKKEKHDLEPLPNWVTQFPRWIYKVREEQNHSSTLIWMARKPANKCH